MQHRYFCFICSVIMLLHAPEAWAVGDMRDVVHTASGRIVVNHFGNCVRTRWLGANDACAAAPRVAISQEERTIYFNFNKFALTPAAVQKLNSLAGRLKADSQVREARIAGYADRIGTASYNEQLSKKRAENVRSYLVSRGFVKGRVTATKWLGESAPVTNCPDTLPRSKLIACLQRDRKVEVEIDYLTNSPR